MTTPTVLSETSRLQTRARTIAAAADLPADHYRLEGAADVSQVDDLIGAASALHGLARLGRGRHVAARLAALVTQVDGDLVVRDVVVDLSAVVVLDAARRAPIDTAGFRTTSLW